MQTTFTNGTILLTLDGSDPKNGGSYFSNDFTVNKTATLRTIAFNADLTQSVESEPLEVTILPILSTVTTGGGTVQIEPPAGLYFDGSRARVTAIANSGWYFLQWLGAGSGTNPVIDITMNRDKHVCAVFGTSVGISSIGGGSVRMIPTAEYYPYGSAIDVIGLPQDGSHFARWGDSPNHTNNPIRLVVTNANIAMAAVFAVVGDGKAALTVVRNGYGQVAVNPPVNRVNLGTSVTLTAVPDLNQEFIGWSGDADSDANPLMITMDKSRIISAIFTARPTLLIGNWLGGMVEEGFQFTASGEIGSRYQFEGSTTLTNWTPITIVTNSFGMVQFTDLVGTNSQRHYYRVMTP